jgi:glycosyltransferase involved in cell wall biosynthesis
LKILIFSERDIKHPWGGGSPLNIHEQAKRWIDDGHEVTMVTTRPKGASYRDTIDGLNVYRAGSRYTVYFCAPFLYLAGLRKRADVVVDIINGIPFFTPLFCRKPKIAIMHHVHREMFLIELGPVLGRVGRAIEQYLVPLLYRKVLIVSSSRSTIMHMGQLLYRGTSLDVSIAYNGIDHDFYRPGTQKFDKPTVLYLGRVKKYKRIPLLIEMMQRVRAELPDAQLVIAGGGDAVEESMATVDRLGAGDYIHFKGYVDEAEKLRLYQQAWVVATASMVEGWGLTVVEANACGTPAVAFDVPGLNESIIHDETGLLSRNEQEFTDNLVSILRDEAMRKKLSEGAMAWAASFTWDQTASHTLDVMKRSMDGTRPA